MHPSVYTEKGWSPLYFAVEGPALKEHTHSAAVKSAAERARAYELTMVSQIVILTILALIPLAVALAMMTVLQRNSRQAGLTTLVLVCSLALVAPAYRLPPSQLLLTMGAGIATSLNVLTVLLPALLLYHLQRVSGGVHTLAQGMARITEDRDLLVLLLVLGFSPFIEGLCGFGVGIVVIAPLLIELRFDALRVALLSLLGQMTTAWGAMGVVMILASSLTGISAAQVGSSTALLSMPTTIILSLVTLLMSGGTAALRRWWPLALVAATTLTGGAWVLSRAFGVELVGILSSACVLALLGGAGALVSRRDSPYAHVLHRGGGGAARQSLWSAATPYAFLTCFLLFSRLLPGPRTWLQTHVVLDLALVHLHVSLLYMPGFWVMIALLLAMGVRSTPSGEIAAAAVAAWRQFAPSALAILFFLLTAQVMQATSMTATLATAAAFLGARYVWLSPWLAGLGAWMTGSNLGGTAMFALLQKEAAGRTGLSLVWLLAAQNGAGTLARMLSPACVLLAATSAGLSGREGLLIRTFGPLVLWAISLITFLLVTAAAPSLIVVCLFIVALGVPFVPALQHVFFPVSPRERTSDALPPHSPPFLRGERRALLSSRESGHFPVGKRSRRLLRELARAQGWRDLRSLSRTTGLTIPTVYRLLRRLHTYGYVIRDDGGHRYALVPLQTNAGERSQAADLLFPYLQEMATCVQEMTQIAVAENGHTSIVAQAQPDRSRRTGTDAQAHRVFPLHRTGLGKVLLAYQPEGGSAPSLPSPDQPRCTAGTTPSPTSLRQELVRIRAYGYAIDNEEQEGGVYTLAVPVHQTSGRVIAALGISGSTRRLSPQILQASLKELLRTSALIGPLMSL